MEASYRLPLQNISSELTGNLTLRGYANYVISLKSADGPVTLEGAGVLGLFGATAFSGLTSPKFRSLASAAYDDDVITGTLTWRHTGGGAYNNSFVQCATACPIGSALTIDENHIRANDVFDVALAVRPLPQRRNLELFLSIDNVLNQDPPFIAGTTGEGFLSGQRNEAYDRLGRTFRLGARVRL